MIFATDLHNPQGTVALAHGIWLTVEGRNERGCVSQLSSDGRSHRETEDKFPTNLAFALPSENRIHVTEYEHGQMESLNVDCDGLALRDGSVRNITEEMHEPIPCG